MKIKSEFPGDNNEIVKNIQDKFYYNVINKILNICKKNYLDACEILDVWNQCREDLYDEIPNYENTFEPIIELLAAIFRYKYCSMQLPLYEKEKREIDYEILWCEFYSKLAVELSNNPDFCRHFIEAYCNQKNFKPEDYSKQEFHPDIKIILNDIKKREYFPETNFRFGKISNS